MAKTFRNIIVKVGSGAVNNRPIVNGSAVIEAGGTNNATVSNAVVLNGGTNSSTAAVTGTLTLNSGTNAAPVTGPATISGGTNSGAITGAATINGGANSGAIAGAVTISSGSNSGVITVGPVTISGGSNSAAITAATTISGGTNSGAITGAATISGGSNSAAITGSVIVSGGTNTGAVTGSVRVTSGGTQNGTVTGNLYLEAGGTISSNTTVTGGGKIYAAADVNVTTALSALTSFSGSVVQVNESGTLTSTTYTAGTAGATTPVSGTFYNLEGGENSNKAFVYDQQGNPTPLNEPKFNLTGDGKAYNWINGTKGSLYTGTIDGVNYVDGVASTGGTGGGGGGNEPYTGTLYYYEGADETDTSSTWASLAAWYKDSAHSEQASALPTVNNATVLLNNTSADMETWEQPASINITGHTLTLTAHSLDPAGCAAARTLSVNVTASTPSNLILQGHINISASINHSESVTIGETTYYYDADIETNDYIYSGRYSSTVATAAIDFAIIKGTKYYSVSTDNTGKATVTEVNLNDPPPGVDPEVILYRILFNSNLSDYGTYDLNKNCTDDRTPGTGLIKLLIPGLLSPQSQIKPVYVLATRTTPTSPWVYEQPKTPYADYFVRGVAVPGGTNYYRYDINGFGFTRSYELCTENP